MFDGMADGKSEAAGQVFQMKTDPYGSVEQLSGSRGSRRRGLKLSACEGGSQAGFGPGLLGGAAPLCAGLWP